IDTSIPGHLVYRSERPFGSGNARLDFTYGGCIVILDRTSVELTEGETTTLVATVAPDDATVKMMAWSTSDETIATVADGVVTAVKAGTATITAKAGDKKATCTVTVKERMTSIVITDPYTENNFTQDEDKENVSITYTRTLNNTEWNALYLPFEIPVSQLTDKYEVAYINAIHSYDEDDNGEIDRMSMEVIKLREGTLHANHPYLIKARTTAAKQMSITVENTTLYKAESRTLDYSSVYTKFEITGIYEKMTSAQLAGCYALSGGSWKSLSSGSSLNPFRLYLRVSSREGSPVKLSEAALARIGIHVQGEGPATSVEERLMQKQHKADAVYDLSGRRITSPKKGQTYIVNGKKRMY
ncbi:MAG: Ig domain-containing protein, partial [Bacteroidaceae bacterium]|nr:Ig domain-containing protein [Bacteroidaceae bacterium]